MNATAYEGSRTMTTCTGTNEQRFRELAYRESGGVEVSLLWDPAENSLSVFVSDTRNGNALELRVGIESPLEVFNHPYAYAASRGIEYETPGKQPALT